MHGGSDRGGAHVCGVQTTGADQIRQEARRRGYCPVLAVVPDLELASPVRMGQVRAGGGRDVVRPRLAQPGPGQRVLPAGLLLRVLRCTLRHHPGLLLQTDVDITPGEHLDPSASS